MKPIFNFQIPNDSQMHRIQDITDSFAARMTRLWYSRRRNIRRAWRFRNQWRTWKFEALRFIDNWKLEQANRSVAENAMEHFHNEWLKSQEKLTKMEKQRDEAIEIARITIEYMGDYEPRQTYSHKLNRLKKEID